MFKKKSLWGTHNKQLNCIKMHILHETLPRNKMASTQLAHRRRQYSLLLQTAISVTIIMILGHGTKYKPLKRADEPQDYPILLSFLPYIHHDTTILTVRPSAATYSQHTEGVVDKKF